MVHTPPPHNTGACLFYWPMIDSLCVCVHRSGLSSGLGVPVYSMDVRGLGSGPERGLCLLHNLRMLHNKTPLASPRPPSPNANTPPRSDTPHPPPPPPLSSPPLTLCVLYVVLVSV
jgi:hypothetical protein